MAKRRELVQDMRLSESSPPKQDLVKCACNNVAAFSSFSARMSVRLLFFDPAMLTIEAIMSSSFLPELLASNVRNKYFGTASTFGVFTLEHVGG
jgi:hypothetical protein